MQQRIDYTHNPHKNPRLKLAIADPSLKYFSFNDSVVISSVQLSLPLASLLHQAYISAHL